MNLPSIVSILVLIEFIFNCNVYRKYISFSVSSLNPCFDRIYFQSDTVGSTKTLNLSLNPCFDRIYFQYHKLLFDPIANYSLNPCFDRIYFQYK